MNLVCGFGVRELGMGSLARGEGKPSPRTPHPGFGRMRVRFAPLRLCSCRSVHSDWHCRVLAFVHSYPRFSVFAFGEFGFGFRLGSGVWGPWHGGRVCPPRLQKIGRFAFSHLSICIFTCSHCAFAYVESNFRIFARVDLHFHIFTLRICINSRL